MKMGYEKIPLKKEYGNLEVVDFGCVFKSKEEHRYAQRLQAQLEKKDIDYWEYEPETFDFGRDGQYTPDFLVIGYRIGTQYHEVKAKLTQKDVGRFRNLRKYYPGVYVVLVYPYCPRKGNQKRLIDDCRKYINEIIYSHSSLKENGNG